eukprot:tig00000241_g20925.t1
MRSCEFQGISCCSTRPDSPPPKALNRVRVTRPFARKEGAHYAAFRLQLGVVILFKHKNLHKHVRQCRKKAPATPPSDPSFSSSNL